VLFPEAAAADAPGTAECSIRTMADRLATYAGEIVLSHVDEAPELLYRTGLLTVGSLYHRNPYGYLRLRAAWESAPGPVVPPAVRATGASLLLVCGDAVPPRSGKDQDLYAALANGSAPPWLEVLLTDPVSHHVLYRVRR
jgi:hypothetical protein